MPYNTTAIPPRKEATGQTQLPLSRVRKIIAVDPDVAICSNNAAFIITLATELFVQYLASEAQGMVKLDRKPRRNVQYKDVAQAAQRIDRLEFLEDTVPATVPFGKVKAAAASAQARLRGGPSGLAGDSSGTAGAAGTGGGSGGGSGRGRRGSGVSGAGAGADEASTVDVSGAGPSSSGTAGTKKSRQQQLVFNILHGDSDTSTTAAATAGTAASPATASNDRGFWATTSSPSTTIVRGIEATSAGSGVAAAAALAHAAAAGTAFDEAEPDAQLRQDMMRMQQDDRGGSSGRRAGHSHGPSRDVTMRDS